MKTESKVKKNLQIKAKLNIPTMQFLTYKNYILSISYERNTVDFYDIKTFKRKFYLKRKRHEKNFYHEKWKLIQTKAHKVFLLGYKNDPENELFYHEVENSKLDIYLLKIGQRKCIKKASFIYYKFKEDEKEDKLYILTDFTIFQYDFLTGTSNELCISKHLPFCNNWVKFFIINNYFVIVFLREVSKWIFLEYCEIIDKNSHSNILLCISSDYYYDMDNYYESQNSFVQTSDKFFSIYSEETSQMTNIVFAEFEINEKIFQQKNYLPLSNKKEIKIKETGKMDIYPINTKNCGISFNYSNYYIFKLPDMEIIIKIDIVFKDKLFLLKFIDDGNDKYRLYLSDQNNLLYIA